MTTLAEDLKREVKRRRRLALDCRKAALSYRQSDTPAAISLWQQANWHDGIADELESSLQTV